MPPSFTFGALSGAPAVLAAGALFDVAVQIAGWIVSVALKTDKIYDFTASCTYVSLALLSFFLGTSGSSSSSPRQVAATVLLTLWAARLGAFLLFRVVRLGGDSRFEEALKKPLLFLVYWLMQALWIFATASGTLWLNGTVGGGGKGLKPTDIIGPLLFLVGFLIESLADAQKLKFRLAVPSNKGKFIDQGLWSLARYPNYFGEIVLQCGLWLLCVPSFGKSAAWLTVLGPVFVAILLLFVSGIPLQEAQAKARWGEGDAGYQAYRKRTRLLVPLPKIWGR
jgi:steroid 5-alpha reductase family enzyme